VPLAVKFDEPTADSYRGVMNRSRSDGATPTNTPRSSPAALPADDPVDFLTDNHVRHAPEFFNQMRATNPVLWSERHRAWVITGHPELDEAFRDRRLSTERMEAFRSRQSGSRAEALAKAIELLDGWMLFHEPPTHTRLRSPLSRRFTARAVSTMGQSIQQIADELLDQMETEAAGGRTIDLVEMFAHPLPAAVIGRLFGVADEDRHWLADWSRKFGAVVFGAVNLPDYEERARQAGDELEHRLGALMDRYRAAPEDNLLSILLANENKEGGLSTVEILGACSILLFAGHDTTASILGSATNALCERPEAAEEFTALALKGLGLSLSGQTDSEPSDLDETGLAGSNLSSTNTGSSSDPLGLAIEELLRFEAPAKAMMRMVVEPHERGGHTLEEGQAVFMGILGANRDPRVFEAPNELNFQRSPNPHLTFGYGHHFCLGAALARLEARIALGGLFTRFPGIQLAGDVEWKPTISDRSAARIPVTLH